MQKQSKSDGDAWIYSLPLLRSILSTLGNAHTQAQLVPIFVCFQKQRLLVFC